MKKRKGVERQRAWRARGKKDIAEEGNVSEDLSEAWIANCYYPGDNKTVTIFADSERGKHERARRRTERTAWRGPKSAREGRQERMTRGPATGNTSGRSAERRTDRRRRAVHLGTRKKENQTRERETRDKEKDLSGSEHPASPFHPLRHPSAFFAVSSLAVPRTLVPPLAYSCSTTPSVTTTPIGRLLQPRSPRSARFSTASRRVLYKGFIIRSFLPHLYRARLGEIFSICFIRFSL